MSKPDISIQLAKDEKALKRISNAIAIYKYSVFQNEQHFESGSLSEHERKAKELDLAHRTLNKIVDAMDVRSDQKFDDQEEADFLPEHVVEFLAMRANHLTADE